jgi:predicted component of type VI protein secretion system
MLPDDSAFCDQCGTELMWCPDCKRPKPNRTRECPVCGNDLVPGRKYLNGIMAQPQPAPQQPQQSRPSTAGAFTPPQNQFNTNAQYIVQQPLENDVLQSTAISGASAPAGPTKIIGNGWVLPLREGQFGRTSGIYPEFATCKYISGKHGTFSKTAAGWMVVDSGSTNGTFINGMRLTPGVGAPIRLGDVLTIATIDFKVQ